MHIYTHVCELHDLREHLIKDTLDLSKGWSQGRADTWVIRGEAGTQSLSHCICLPLLAFAFQDGGSSYVNQL